MAAKISITIIASNGEKTQYGISNEKEFSRLLEIHQADHLKKQSGLHIYSFQSLEHGRTYTAIKYKKYQYTEQELEDLLKEALGIPKEDNNHEIISSLAYDGIVSWKMFRNLQPEAVEGLTKKEEGGRVSISKFSKRSLNVMLTYIVEKIETEGRKARDITSFDFEDFEDFQEAYNRKRRKQAETSASMNTSGKRNAGDVDSLLGTPPLKLLRSDQTEGVETPPEDRSQQALPVPYLTPTIVHGIPREASVILGRKNLVNCIRDRVNRVRQVTIIRSPPGTGKSSLLTLIKLDLETRPINGLSNKVLQIDMKKEQEPLRLLERELEFNRHCVEDINVDNHHQWVLIDDAQLAFDKFDFWKVVTRDFAESRKKNLHVVIAATYDLCSAYRYTPISFGEYPHIDDLKLSKAEAEKLYDGYVSNSFAKDWMGFKDTLLRLADGHVGVLTGGISMLHRMYTNGGIYQRLSECEALDALRDDRFGVVLDRCFPCPTRMNDDERKAVGAIIVPSRNFHIDSSQRSTDHPALVNIVRYGILSSQRNKNWQYINQFTCLAAQWQYFNRFYERLAQPGPSSIEDLVVQAVKSMSATRLQKSACENEDFPNFPEAAAFLHLFHEAFTMLLPHSISVLTELNTFAKDSDGNIVSGELDFFIAGKHLNWVMELLRKLHKINEHVRRFDPTNRKYRCVEHTAHLVVNCSGPRAKIQPVQSRHDLCTLYFSADFKSVEIQMRERPLVETTLMD